MVLCIWNEVLGCNTLGVGEAGHVCVFALILLFDTLFVEIINLQLFCDGGEHLSDLSFHS